MHWRLLPVILACLPVPLLAQSTYTFQSTPGTHPFSFSNPYYPWASNPLGAVSLSTPITLHDSATNIDAAATLQVFSELQVTTNLPANVTGGISYDQPLNQSGHFFIFDPSHTTQLINAFYSGDIVGNLGSNNAVFSGQLYVNSATLPISLGDSATFSFTLTSVTPAAAISPTGTLNDFTADFSAQITAIPEPATLALLAVLSPLALRRRS